MRSLIVDTSYNDYSIRFSGCTNDGVGPVLLCLHGIQGSATTFESLFSQEFISRYHVIAVDLVGFGDSSKPNNFSYRLFDQAMALRQLMQELGHIKYHILGHSLGGMIGTLLLEQIPDQVLSLINLEGNLVLDDCGNSRQVAAMLFEDFRDSFFLRLIEQQRIRGFEQMALSMEKVPAKIFHKTARDIVEVSRSEHLLRVLRQSSHPILFLIGKENSFKSHPPGARIQIEEIDGADHFMLPRHPAAFAAIKGFLKTL